MHPAQVSRWKTILRKRMPELFKSGSKPGEATRRRLADLHGKVGELAVNLDYLGKKTGNSACEPAPSQGRGGRRGKRA